MSLVEVRIIEKDNWHGYKGRDTIKNPVTIEALVSGSTSKFVTGLTEEDRAKYEDITGWDLSDRYSEGTPHPFYSHMGRVTLPSHTLIFDTDNPLDYIKLCLVKASQYVANSMTEYNQGLYPEASHVIYDENETILSKATKSAKKKEAFIASHKLSKTMKKHVIWILLGVESKDASDDFLDVKIFEIIENELSNPDLGPKHFLRVLSEDKDTTAVHALVKEALYKNVLRKQGSAIKYMDNQISHDLNSAIDYLVDPANQLLRAEIVEKLK